MQGKLECECGREKSQFTLPLKQCTSEWSGALMSQKIRFPTHKTKTIQAVKKIGVFGFLFVLLNEAVSV